MLRLEGWARNLPCIYKSQNDVAADLIHIYAYTKYFYNLSANMQEYKAATSSPAYISQLGLGSSAKVQKPSRHLVYGPGNEIYAGKNDFPINEVEGPPGLRWTN
nr:histone-lysine n-methyltransferase atxr3 [Quercus suber]